MDQRLLFHKVTMDPRTGSLPSAHSEHQQLIQSLVAAGVLAARENATEDEPQFYLTGKRKRRGVHLPKAIELSISWGYEIHSIKVNPRFWAAVVAGEELSHSAYGWYEGKRFPMEWNFNCGDIQNLYITYGNDGGVGYEGNVFDLYIAEYLSYDESSIPKNLPSPIRELYERLKEV